MIRRAVIIALFGFLFFQANHGNAELLKLAGSTTFQKRIIEPTVTILQETTGIQLKVAGVNSGNGFKLLMEGKITASISSSPLSNLLDDFYLPADGTYIQHPVMVDTIVHIVHKTNPVSELSWEQLSQIHTGKITNWKTVGGPDKKILIITSQPNSATRLVFQKMVMQSAPYLKGAVEAETTRHETILVSKFKGSIGAVSQGFVDMYPDRVKIIKAKTISRPLSIITQGKPTLTVQKVLDFLRLTDTQKLFK